MLQRQKTLSLTLGLVIGVAISPSASAQFFETRGSSTLVSGPSFVTVGDFNQDGNQDLAMAFNSACQVAILLGNGDGTFQKAVYYDVGNYPKSMAVADLNGDGQLDLAVANYLGGTIGLLFGNGDGTFQPQTEIVLGDFPMTVLVGDVNGDHAPDLVTLNSQTFSALLGNGNGTFQPPIFTPLTGAPLAFGVGDFDQDDKLDVAVSGELPYFEADIYPGNGDGTFRTGPHYRIGDESIAMAVADFRNLGKVDLALAELLGGVVVLLGNGDDTFQKPVIYNDIFPESIATGDFNEDGRLDFVTSNAGCSDGSCTAGATVFTGNGDGTFKKGLLYPVGLLDDSVAVADFNGDSWPDLAIADSGTSAAAVLLNTGTVSFSPTTPVLFAAQLLNTTSSPKPVTLTNNGKTTLSINSITVQGSDFRLSSSTTCASSVAPGASCNIVTMFHPQTKGLKSALISIQDSASTKPQVIQLFGSGTIVTVSPTQLSFPPTKAGTKSAPLTVTLTDQGTVPLNITRVALGGKWPNQYFQTNVCPAQLAPGASCTISVTFAPNAKGSWPANVSVTDDGGGSPQTVTLTGKGT